MLRQYESPFKINLQLHADGDGAEPVIPGYNAIEGDIRSMLGETPATEPAPAAPEVPPAEPTAVEPPATPVEPDPAPAASEPAPPAPEPANDPMTNPVVQQLMQVIQQQQDAIKQQSEMMQQYIQNTMTNNAPQPSPQVTKTPEEMEAEKEQWMASFYERGPAAVQELIEQSIKGATEPLQKKLSAYEEKEAWNDAVGGMALDKEHYPEFDSVRQRMSEILFKERPYLRQSGDIAKSLADAYALALFEKGPAVQQPLATPAQPANPADMMKNQDFIKQLTSNPEVMKLIAAEHAKQIQAQSRQVPPMSPSSGVANVAPYIQNKPTNYNDLESDIRNSLRQGTL